VPVLICTDDLTMLEHLVLLVASIKSSLKPARVISPSAVRCPQWLH